MKKLLRKIFRPRKRAKGKQTLLKRIFRIIKYAIIIFFVSSILTVVLYRFVRPPFTPLMVIRLFDQAFGPDKIRLKKKWKPLDKISGNMVMAVVAAEDQRFTEHFGFDFDAMKKAYKNNKRGRRIKGASTISQQVAKNVFLWPGRSYTRKGFEAYFTLLIELTWPKERIMEMYLNVVELGKGIYGVEMASQFYFHKPAKTLTIYEAAAIASVLPNPRKWSPVKQGPYIQRRTNWIVRNMYNLERIKY
jgi:monofunctional glycosyltransferase